MEVGFLQLFLIVAVSFCIPFCSFAIYYDWDWFFQIGYPRFFVFLLGRKGARIFYSCLVLFFIVVVLVALYACATDNEALSRFYLR